MLVLIILMANIVNGSLGYVRRGGSSLDSGCIEVEVYGEDCEEGIWRNWGSGCHFLLPTVSLGLPVFWHLVVYWGMGQLRGKGQGYQKEVFCRGCGIWVLLLSAL